MTTFFFARNKYGGIQNFVFQEDNIKPHRAIAVKVYLKGRGVKTMFWPAQSPDLNPIENAPDTIRMKKSFSIGFEKFGLAYQNYFQNLVPAMHARAKNVTENRIASTKY